MNYKNNLSGVVIILGILVSGSIIGSAMAQTLQPQEQKILDDIQFPIPELGNCTSKENCKLFCDDSKNIDACLKFAEERKLMSSEELASAKKFKDVGMVGPGGCKGRSECDNYCGNPDNMEQCIAFAVKNDMMDPRKKEESQKVLAAIKRGVKPPACNGPEACDKYCSSSDHMEECINFGIEAGIMDKNKQEGAQKVLAAIKRGVKPPACNGPEACDKYCGSEEHMEECINFGIEAGMMPEQEREKAQKMLAVIKQGIKPPACRGEQECRSYCAQESHLEECIKFGEATGIMKPEDAAMMRKTGGRGPGGCTGKDTCDAFCNNPDNQETCFNFAKENGMIPEDQLQKMQEGQQRMKDSFSQMPQEVLDCLNSSLGADVVEKIKAGIAMPGPKTGDAMRGCFEKNMPQGQAGKPGQDSPNNMPGDLRDCIQAQVGEDGLAKIQSGDASDPALMEKAKSCFEKYGQQNQQGRSDQQGQNQQGQPGNNFKPEPGAVNPGGQQMPQQAGPGGCRGPEDCRAYCESHQEECKNFQPQQDQQRGPGEGFDRGRGEQFIPGDIQRSFNPIIGEQQIREPFVCEGDKCNIPFEQGRPVPAPGQPIPFYDQPGQIPPQGIQPIQGQQQPFIQPQPIPPQGDSSGFQLNPPAQQSPPSSFIENAEKILGNVLNVFR